jgi:hypothetical protein
MSFICSCRNKKIGAELHIYLEEGTYHKRLFRGRRNKVGQRHGPRLSVFTHTLPQRVHLPSQNGKDTSLLTMLRIQSLSWCRMTGNGLPEPLRLPKALVMRADPHSCSTPELLGQAARLLEHQLNLLHHGHCVTGHRRNPLSGLSVCL